MMTHATYHTVPNPKGWGEESWMPVPLRGFRLEFEMSPLGCVRRRSLDGTGCWVRPSADLGGGRGWGYRLECASGRAELAAVDIFGAFGVAEPRDAHGAARARARRANSRLRRELLTWDTLCRLMLEAEERELDELLAAIDRGCPWERGRVRGDARGADPVLGF